MAIKLADTLVPMADFPAVEAKDIAFNDNKSLQEKYDNGELGGGGTSITVDTTMSSTSTNPVQNKVIKEYVDSKSIDISADLDNAIQTKTDGIYVEKTKISTDDGNALSKKSDGLFVEDLSNKVNALNIAQKTVNSELEYYYATKTTSISGVPIKHSNLINYLSYLTNITSNLEPSRYNTKGVTLKKSKTYRITFGLARATTSGNGTSAYVMDSDGNKLGNRGYFGSNSYSDNIIDVIYTPTKDISVYPALVNLNTNLESTYYPDCSFFQITEIGREVTIDPVEYVDSTKGIEDTPVGEIITTLGDETPKHYLACDGSTHNIADYPHLAQYFKDTFGTINYFGGDGITTFAVPKLSEPKLTKISPIMTSDTTPSPYVVTRSSVWSTPADHAWRIFDGIKTDNEDYTWISADNELNPWICVDLGTKTKMTSFKLWLDTGKNKFPEDFTLQGSNDGTNFTNIKSFTNVSSMAQSSEGEIEFNLDRIAEYRYYKIYVDTLQITGGATYVRISEWEMFYQNPLYKNCIKYEPTYYMELNQAAYINQYCDVYSTDEKIVGKWVDGKPLYRKSYEVTSPSASNSSTVLFTYSSDTEIQDIDGCILAPDENIPVNFYYSTDNYVSCWSNHKNKQIKMVVSNSDYTSRPAIITILYTKTTDAPNSFDYGMIMDQFAQEALVDVAVTDAEVDKCFE